MNFSAPNPMMMSGMGINPFATSGMNPMSMNGMGIDPFTPIGMNPLMRSGIGIDPFTPSGMNPMMRSGMGIDPFTTSGINRTMGSGMRMKSTEDCDMTSNDNNHGMINSDFLSGKNNTFHIVFNFYPDGTSKKKKYEDEDED